MTQNDKILQYLNQIIDEKKHLSENLLNLHKKEREELELWFTIRQMLSEKDNQLDELKNMARKILNKEQINNNVVEVKKEEKPVEKRIYKAFGPKIGKYHTCAIYKYLYEDIYNLLSDGKKHLSKEFHKIIMEYYSEPFHSRNVISDILTRYFGYMRENIKEEFFKQHSTSGHQWEYRIKPKIIVEHAKESKKIKESNGRFSVTPESNKDRKVLKNFPKFRWKK